MALTERSMPRIVVPMSVVNIFKCNPLYPAYAMEAHVGSTAIQITFRFGIASQIKNGLLQKITEQRGLVGRQIVQDDVNLLARWTQGHNFFEKGSEIAAGIDCSGLSVNATSGCIQGRIDGEIP